MKKIYLHPTTTIVALHTEALMSVSGTGAGGSIDDMEILPGNNHKHGFESDCPWDEVDVDDEEF